MRAMAATMRRGVAGWMAALWFIPSALPAATNYVNPASAGPATPYTSWATAARDIQSAVAAAADGNVVLVTNGVYYIPNEIRVTRPLTVRSVSGMTNTIVDARGSNRCFYLASPAAEVSGFTLHAGVTNLGGGAFIQGAGTVTNCRILNCAALDSGGGVYCASGGTVVSCLVVSNQSVSGAGIYLDNGGTARNCTILGNTGIDEGGGMHCAVTGLVENCVVVRNAADSGGGIWSDDGVAIRNCTVALNTGGGLSGGQVENSIVRFNYAALGNANLWGSTVVWSCTDPLWDGPGNIASDPEFMDMTNNDFRLRPGSPCLNTGTNQGWMASATDLAGEARIVHGTVDMGAYEFRTNTLVCNAVASPREGFPPLAVTLRASVAGTNLSNLYYRWDFNNDGTYETNGPGLSVVTNSYPTAGCYSVKLMVSNAAAQQASVVRTGYITVAPGDLYVSTTGGNAFPYGTWGTAARSIQSAVDAAVAGSVVWITNGTYGVTNAVNVEKGITVRSVNGAATVIVDGGGTTRCLRISHSNAVVRGVTLRNGVIHNTWSGGGGALLNGGGTLQDSVVSDCSSPDYHCNGGGVCFYGGGVVTQCVILRNWAHGGGGVQMMYGGELRDSTVVSNAGSHSAGIMLYWGGLLDHCRIVQNSATNGSGAGCTFVSGGEVRDCVISNNNGNGAWFAETGGLLRDSLVISNRAGNAGGGVLGGPQGVVTGCVITGNWAPLGGGLYLNKGGEVQGCTISSNSANSGGGVVFSRAGSLAGCTIVGNAATANDGGGVNIDRGGTLADCVIWGNTAANVGGGISVYQSGTVERCTLAFNVASAGGGMYSGAGAVVLSDSVVSNNLSLGWGGGLWCESSDRVENCTVVFNRAAEGAGVSCGDSAVLTNCVIRGNVATNNGGGVSCDGGGFVRNCLIEGNQATTTGGGGVYCYKTGTVDGCVVRLNSAGWGGGLGGNEGGLFTRCEVTSNSTLGSGFGGGVCLVLGGQAVDCRIRGNNAYGGGGVYLNQGGTLRDCLLNGNASSGYGGGITLSQGGLMQSCTVVSNTTAGSGGGVRVATLGTVENSIVYHNDAPAGPNYYGTGLTMLYSCTTPDPGSAGCITTDPGFVSLATEDYRLTTNSPCFDRGTNQGWMASAYDLDGRPRIVNTVVDMGCYELIPPSWDADGDGLPDVWEWDYSRSMTNLANGGDDDGDSLTNGAEYVAGTDPTDSSSVFELVSLARSGATDMNVNWASVAGKTYAVDRATNLLQKPAFTGVQDSIPGQPGTTAWTDTNAVGAPALFYRVRVR